MAEAITRYLVDLPCPLFTICKHIYNNWFSYFSSVFNFRSAVVTGANKGMGLEICRQLAASGVRVVLTARDEKRGVEALQSLNGSGLSNLVFHQLDVGDPASIASFADFIKTQFGKLDILVRLKPWSFLDDFFFPSFLFYWFFFWQFI